jgi:hypothetical protein
MGSKCAIFIHRGSGNGCRSTRFRDRVKRAAFDSRAPLAKRRVVTLSHETTAAVRRTVGRRHSHRFVDAFWEGLLPLASDFADAEWFLREWENGFAERQSYDVPTPTIA